MAGEALFAATAAVVYVAEADSVTSVLKACGQMGWTWGSENGLEALTSSSP